MKEQTPVEQFNEAFGFHYDTEPTEQLLAAMVEVAKLRGRGDIAARLLLMKRQKQEIYNG